MNKIAIITGANGFIGKRILREYLNNNYFVYAITNDPDSLSDIDSNNFINICLLFEDYWKMPNLIQEEQIDVFIHCAWQGVWGKAFEDYELQMKNAVNAGKTLEIALILKSKRFILLSTVNVLEVKNCILNCSEYKSLRSTTNYAMAKIAAETICRTLASRNNIIFNCAYLSMVFGEGNYSMMVPNVVISKLLKNESPDLIAGDSLYDLIYVGDVSSAIFAIGEKGVNFKSYYVGNRKLSSFKSLFSKIGKIINPNITINFGAYPDSSFIDYSLINLDELYEDTGFEINDIDFEKHIYDTADWISNNLI